MSKEIVLKKYDFHESDFEYDTEEVKKRIAKLVKVRKTESFVDDEKTATGKPQYHRIEIPSPYKCSLCNCRDAWYRVFDGDKVYYRCWFGYYNMCKGAPTN